MICRKTFAPKADTETPMQSYGGIDLLQQSHGILLVLLPPGAFIQEIHGQ